jgi:hypothetical protein
VYELKAVYSRQICRKVDAYTSAVVVSGIYQNYRNGAVSIQLKDVGWWERGCWGKTVNLLKRKLVRAIPFLGIHKSKFLCSALNQVNLVRCLGRDEKPALLIACTLF